MANMLRNKVDIDNSFELAVSLLHQGGEIYFDVDDTLIRDVEGTPLTELGMMLKDSGKSFNVCTFGLWNRSTLESYGFHINKLLVFGELVINDWLDATSQKALPNALIIDNETQGMPRIPLTKTGDIPNNRVREIIKEVIDAL